MRPVKTQISLGIRSVWSESSLSAWWHLGSLATHWAHSEDFDQTGRMPRLIWVFAGRTCHFVCFVMRRLIYSNKLPMALHFKKKGRGCIVLKLPTYWLLKHNILFYWYRAGCRFSERGVSFGYVKFLNFHQNLENEIILAKRGVRATPLNPLWILPYDKPFPYNTF